MFLLVKSIRCRPIFRTISRFTSQKQQKPQIDPNGNYYQQLELPRTATIAEIKKSYYTSLRKYHPDFQKGLQNQLEKTKKAYQILSDPDLKNHYDNLISQKASQSQSKQKKQNYQNVGPGPYQSQEEYKKYSQKGFYGKSRFEWRKIRMGTRKQSYINLESERFLQQGSTGDDNILHHFNKREFLQEMQQKSSKQNQPTAQQLEKLKQRDKMLKQRHMQRVKKARMYEDQNNWLSRLSGKISNWLSSGKH